MRTLWMFLWRSFKELNKSNDNKNRLMKSFNKMMNNCFDENCFDSVETTIVHVEVIQKKTSCAKMNEIKSFVSQWIECNASFDHMIKQLNERNAFVVVDKFSCDSLSSHVDSINISLSPNSVSVNKNDTNNALDQKPINKYECKQYVFQLNEENSCDEELNEDENRDGEQMPASLHTFLPSNEFHGVWESLIFEDNTKDQLLSFVVTSLLFADQKVNSKLITWNKVVLLHGPPGTGKTSLCKALAHKLSIRLKDKYKSAQLIEINSHSLFSKWFSESGKLVMKLFQKIREYVQLGDQLVFVLIDEVESLAHTRNVSMSGNEPSDAIRVVNALLTQIDIIKNYPNVVILTTSNVTDAIDDAFVDRADIKQFISLPSVGSIYEIYRSCIRELIRSNIIISDETILSYHQLNSSPFVGNVLTGNHKLLQISRESLSLSGRSLRKLPFLAIALFGNGSVTLKLNHFLDCLQAAVKKQFNDRKELNSTK